MSLLSQSRSAPLPAVALSKSVKFQAVPTGRDDVALLGFTSGTTGDPKGVVYSHRTIFLHSLASMAANAFALSDRDTILLLPPMFHANAWGLAHIGVASGATLVMPGPDLSPAAIVNKCAHFWHFRHQKLLRPAIPDANSGLSGVL